MATGRRFVDGQQVWFLLQPSGIGGLAVMAAGSDISEVSIRFSDIRATRAHL